jgi:putative hydrolase of the HAD superfamily
LWVDRVIFWDFDGTLAFRPGMWRGCLIETLDEYEPGHGVESDQLRPFLHDGFPWHRPDVPHPELCEPEAWWTHVEILLTVTYEGVGLAAPRAGELARLARHRYVDPNRGWRLFDDSLRAVERLRGDGWRHAILSSHVPELPALVTGLGLEPLIDVVLTSAATGYEKPNPKAFELALECCGWPGETLMVGDNPVADVAGAEAAGIPAVLVRSEPQARLRYAPDLDALAAILGRTA